MYSSGASDKIFVLAFDYRGFGRSTGTPSEAGLLNDAEAVVEWALQVAGVPADRIVLLGHSLGTAVAAAIAERYSSLATPVPFAGLILCAAFTNSGNAFSSYSIADVLPVLAPVRLIPALQTWFSRRMRDRWATDDRLVSLVRQSPTCRLVLVHAMDDMTMPWNQTEELFAATTRAAGEHDAPSRDGDGDDEPEKRLQTIDLGEAGTQHVWTSHGTSISKLIAKHGGEYCGLPPLCYGYKSYSHADSCPQTTTP
jgi:pimeloyl-ACP methyl ester carboxylesterase